MTVKIDDLVPGESKWDQKQNANNHSLATGINNVITDTGWVTSRFTILNGFTGYTSNEMDKLGYKIQYTNGKTSRVFIKGSFNPAPIDSNTAELLTVPTAFSGVFGANPQLQSHWVGFSDTGQTVNLNVSLKDSKIGLFCTGKISDLHRIQINNVFSI